MTIGHAINKIKAWIHGDNYREWLFCYIFNEVSDLPTDSDGDIWSVNRSVFRAYTDKRLLLKALRRARKEFLDKDANYYREIYAELDR